MKRRNLPVLLQLMFFAVLLMSCGTKLPYAGKSAIEPRVVLRLDSGENNPRNSEGDFVELKDGSLLFIYSHYYGESAHDHATANLASRISKDRGITWSSSDKIEVNNEGGLNVMSVSLLRLQTGEIALFYLRKNTADDCIPMMRLSRDEAGTWGDAVPCITDKEGYFVLNNDRVIQLSNGRLILAVAQHNVPGGQFNGKGKLYSYYSDDKGQTWHSSAMVPNPEDITFQEPGLVHLKDNSLLMVIRSDAGTQCYSKSMDMGQTWGSVTRSTLISPVSPATIERIPGTGDLLAVWNYNLSTDEAMSKERTPLSIAISGDEGVSWQKIRTLEDDPDGFYCYTAMQFVDEGVLLGYLAASRIASENRLANLGIRVQKIDLAWIYQ